MDDTNPKDKIGITKPNLHLVPPALKIHVAKAMENGAKKFGPYNWREKKVRGTIYVSAAMRHIDSYLDGEECAKDSGVHHLAHAAACLGILLDALETGNLIDDRPTKGAAAALIERFTEKPVPTVVSLAPVLRDYPTSALPFSEPSPLYAPPQSDWVAVPEKCLDQPGF